GGGVRTAEAEVSGPVGEVGVEWIYETRGGVSVTQVVEVLGGVVVVASDGSLAKLERAGGKLLWERSQVSEVVAGSKRTGAANQVLIRRRAAATRGRYVSQRELGVVVPAEIASDARGRLFLPLGDRIGCLDGEDGRVLWENGTGFSLPKLPVPNQQGGSGIAVPPMRLFVDGTRLVVFSPEAGRAMAFLTTNGKVLWERSLLGDGGRKAMPSGLGSGADYSEGMLFVYGNTPAVLDGATGEMVWRFGSGRVRKFPMRLEAKGEGEPASFGGIAGIAPAVSKAANLSYTGAANLHPYYARQFVESGGSLVAPAVQWSMRLEQGESGFARMAGRRLLLMDRDGVLALSLDLPLGAVRYPGTGSFVGSSGNKVVLLGNGGKELVILNLTKRTIDSIPLGEVGEVGSPGAMQLAVGGARVYAAGSKGILCVNMHTGGRVFFQEWPELAGVGDGFVEEEVVTGNRVVRQQQATPSMQYFWQGQAVLTGKGLVSCRGMVNSVGNGRLYAVVGENRVVALGDNQDEGGGDGGL
ncbi:MAG: PQQ-binding-like beta-propeller repeat protein, partial [Verrucomicrobiales bacterium]|nr:PQQ-binding-like beta-propeller repeat protein [Verrucomicrobiales bacterium]